MVYENSGSRLRSLTVTEVDQIAGGSNQEGVEVIVTARKMAQDGGSYGGSSGSFFMSFNRGTFGSAESFFNSFFDDEVVVTQDVPAPTSVDGDIIVEATPEQVAAAKQAYADAGVRLSTFQVLAAIGGALISRGLGAAVAGTNEVVDINRDSLQNAYADMLYYQDGSDGRYDGYRISDYGGDGILMPSN